MNTRRLAAISEAKQKTDRRDTCTLAQLLAARIVQGNWQPDEQTRTLRRLVARRASLIVNRVRAKNEILAALHRNLAPRPPMTDAFGLAGRRWLAQLALPADERDTIDAALRQIDFLTEEITTIERHLAEFALASQHAHRLLTVPGVRLTTATTFLAHVGDIRRFQTPGRLVGYLGLDPKLRQSGNQDPRPGRISKEGAALARHVLVEAALTAVRSPGPLRGFYERVRARRGHQIAIVATARKMTVLFWHLLTNEQDYAFSLPTPTAKKMRTIELKAGATRRKPGGPNTPINRARRREFERQTMRQAQTAYEHTVADWHRVQRQRNKAVTRA